MESRRGKQLVSKVGWVVAASVILLAGGFIVPRSEPVQGKISNQVLVDTENGQHTSFIVYLNDQADVSAAYDIADQDARGWYVYLTLKEHAERTQGGVRAELDNQGIPYRSFWAANVIIAEGDREAVETVAALPDVKLIESNHTSEWIRDDNAGEETHEGFEIAATEPGVNNVQAPQVWNLGATGQGIVVANQDTGMRWTHAAIRTKYRGWISGTTADHNYNYWDSIHFQLPGSSANNVCGRNNTAPCDDNGHGTHTTGTAVGDDAGAGVGTGTNQVGVAPGARWIGCRNMDAGNGRPYTYTECFQFFIAPTDITGQNPDPTRRPHVMNNSWGCPPSEECSFNTLKTIVENTQAAGIFVVASAGNSGSACGTVQDPPALYEASFSVGAISGTTNALQSFSSRGPVTIDGSNRMKPEIVAPGASVRSGTRTSDTAYSSSSGTSMAGPHVVGVVALLWSGRPNLNRDIARTKQLLVSTANPAVTVGANASGCGGIATIPNNHFGYGRVNALAAYNAEPNMYQTINFPAIDAKVVGGPDFDAGATSTVGLPISYSASGTCSIVGGMVRVNSMGFCTVTASQPGNASFYAANDVSQTFFIGATSTQRVVGQVMSLTAGTAELRITNQGAGIARDVVLNQVVFRTLAGTGTVSLLTPLPIAIGTLEPGQSATVPVDLSVPAGVSRFSMTENGTLKNAGGSTLSFSLVQMVSP